MIYLININENFQTSRARRLLSIYYALEGAGYDAHVISADFDHGQKAKLHSDNPHETLIKVFAYRSHFSIFRLCNHMWFSLAVLCMLLKRRDAEAVYVSSIPPELVFATIIVRALWPKVPIIVDVRDVWPESVPDKMKSSIRSRLFSFYANTLYSICLPRADEVVLSNPDFASYADRFGCHSIVVPLGYDAERFALVDEHARSGMVYIGNFNESFDLQALAPFLKDGSQLTLIGDGPLRAQYEFIFGEAVFAGFADYYEVPKLLSKYEIGVLPITGNATLPNKLYDYYASGLNVVTNCQSAASFWSLGRFQEMDCGAYFVKHEDLDRSLFTTYVFR